MIVGIIIVSILKTISLIGNILHLEKVIAIGPKYLLSHKEIK